MLNVVCTQLCNYWISFPPVSHLSLLAFCLPARARLICIVMTRVYACKAATLKCVNGLIFIHGIPGRVQTHKNAGMKYLKIIYSFTYVALQMPGIKNSWVTLHVIYGIHFSGLTEHLKNDFWPELLIMAARCLAVTMLMMSFIATKWSIDVLIRFLT